MFWKNLCMLCNKHNTTPNTVCRELGLSSATATHWRQGAIPRDTTLKKIADYFGITPEDLLRDPAEKVAAPADLSPSLPPLSPEFYELLNQMTLQELAELKADMEEKIKNRR
jgi:transcriptional regulator with XRE-family HTH domain